MIVVEGPGAQEQVVSLGVSICQVTVSVTVIVEAEGATSVTVDWRIRVVVGALIERSAQMFDCLRSKTHQGIETLHSGMAL